MTRCAITDCFTASAYASTLVCAAWPRATPQEAKHMSIKDAIGIAAMIFRSDCLISHSESLDFRSRCTLPNMGNPRDDWGITLFGCPWLSCCWPKTHLKQD